MENTYGGGVIAPSTWRPMAPVQLPRDLCEWLGRRTLLESRKLQHERLAERCRALRAWQCDRVARTYDDLRRNPRFRGAIEFFLSDLYGLRDAARRDQEVARAWGLLALGLPEAALELLRRAVELGVLSDELDQAMAMQLPEGSWSDAGYAAAYRTVGRRKARERQIDLVAGMGAALERSAGDPLVAAALRAARVPAHIAGFGALHDFLERGYAAFRDANDASELMSIVRERETRLMERLLRS